jgi:hypothetical protein
MLHFHAMTLVLLALLGFTLVRGGLSFRAWPWRMRWYAAVTTLCIIALLCVASPAVWGWQALGAAAGVLTGVFAARHDPSGESAWRAWLGPALHWVWLLPLAARIAWDVVAARWNPGSVDPWLAALLYPLCVHFAYVGAYRARAFQPPAQQGASASVKEHPASDGMD